ncbi:MAG: c-type cytochrome [Bacteroidia bacterium]
MLFNVLRYTHYASVSIFVLIYLVKTIFLLSNKNEQLTSFTKMVKVPEMIVSTLFLLTGIYMLTQIPEINTLLIIKIIVVFTSIPLAVIGFKKRNKALGLISFIMIIAAWGLAEMSKMPKSDSAANSNREMIPEPDAAMNSERIFVENCAKCHGDDGRAGLLGSPDLSTSAKTLDEKIDIIKNGKGAMTSFSNMLTDDQIRGVAEYTEKLKK